MKKLLFILYGVLSGLLFGLGLSLSGMINPAKVLNFLNVTGDWDPSLAFVMGGALLVSVPGHFLIHRTPRPLLQDAHPSFSGTKVTGNLVVGSLLFGLGWGLAGICPGPALASLVLGQTQSLVFVGAMLVGMLLFAGYKKLPKRG